jgi:hypothetical protein
LIKSDDSFNEIPTTLFELVKINSDSDELPF